MLDWRDSHWTTSTLLELLADFDLGILDIINMYSSHVITLEVKLWKVDCVQVESRSIHE